MLDFIWHLRGFVALDGLATNEVALDAVVRLLKKQRKPITGRGSDFVIFDDPLWRDPFGPNWLAMVMYDRGTFRIEQGLNGRRLRYELRSLHGMVFCLFGALMGFLVGIAAGGFLGGLKFAAVAFGWLYGMNVLLALWRIPRSIRKAVRAT